MAESRRHYRWPSEKARHRVSRFIEESTATLTALSGSVLGYLAYSFVWIAVVVTYIGVRHNWQNNPHGLAFNTALVALTDLGLVIFLV